MNEAVITVDIETDWGGRLKPEAENMRGIYEGLDITLKLFSDFNIPVTFFISSEVIKESGGKLQEIKNQGHEIASHGHNHLELDRLPKDILKDQINKSIDLLQETFNEKVIGFRSPQFRLNEAHFEILSELNIKYDSSVVPSLFPGRYQNISAGEKPYFEDSILEIPVSTFSIFKIPLGLLWMNLIGLNYSKLFAVSGNPIILYFHLFDILPEKKGGTQFNWIVNRWYRMKQNNALNTLNNFISAFNGNDMRFVRMADIYRSYQ